MSTPLDLGWKVREGFELDTLLLNYVFSSAAGFIKGSLCSIFIYKTNKRGADLFEARCDVWSPNPFCCLLPTAPEGREHNFKTTCFRRSPRILSTLKSYFTSSLQQSLLKKCNSTIMNQCGSCRQVFSNGLNYIFTLVSFRSENLEEEKCSFPPNSIICPKSSK